MSSVLKLLHVEDSETDADLVIRSLEKGGYIVQGTRVEDEVGMRDALDTADWDVIVADYHVPGFKAPEALAILGNTGRDIPFIVVSGAIGEDVAVGMMKAGANDYVLKSNLARLAPAVEREIRDAQMRLDRKLAEITLRESQERFRTAFENGAIGMALASNNGRLSSANNALCEMLGYSSAELVGLRLEEIAHPPDQGAETDVVNRMTGPEWTGIGVEKQYIRKDGDLIWAQVHSAVLRDSAGTPNGFIIHIQNVTERRRAEEALRNSEARERARVAEIEAVMDAAPVALFISRDSECRKMIGNRQTYELLRLPFGVNLSKSADKVERPTTFCVMRNGIALAPGDLPVQTATRTGRAVEECEFDLVFEDGTTRQMFGNAVPLLDDTGKAHGAVGGFIDVTARKLAEERLRQAQKLESIGLLAGGIAHDFNNILTAVSGNLTLAIEDLCPGCEVKSILEVAIESVERAAGLTRQLLAYAGKGAFVRSRVSISEVAEKTIRLLQASTPKNVHLRSELAPDLPPLVMDPSQMEQIFINVVLNGIEAIGDRELGTVTVSTGHSDGFLRLVVSDTGSGMDEVTRKRIFEPFFTTKFLGRGLGLAAVDGIVRSLNGKIAVDSAVGSGTRLEILLPASQIPDVQPRPVAPVLHVPAQGAAVLVVDDEPQVRKMAAAFLKRKGIRVLEASNGKEAINVLATSGEDIRAVLLDMAMPELTGDQALPAMLELRPDLQVIVSSGFSDIEVKQHFSTMNIRSYLPKPYSGEELLAHVLPVIVPGPAPTPN